MNIPPNLTASYNYESYRKLVLSYADENKTSGEKSKERIEATLINAQRMKRIDKQCTIHHKLQTLVSQINKKQKWLLISESWCGDSSQCVPVIAKMVEKNENITLTIIFRDEHLDIMDCFLTNGSRSIPKLICIDESNDEIIATWGPRPKAIQDKVIDFKNNFPIATHEELVKNIHLWYAQDKTNAIQTEFIDLLKKVN